MIEIKGLLKKGPALNKITGYLEDRGLNYSLRSHDDTSETALMFMYDIIIKIEIEDKSMTPAMWWIIHNLNSADFIEITIK